MAGFSLLNRRQWLARSALLGTGLTLMPGMAFARVPSHKRLLFVIQRGAADGLGTLAPIGDPGFAGLRGDWAEAAQAGPRAGSFFAIHPRLANVASAYREKQALFVHAVATNYRARSHFDGQNLLESGAAKPYGLSDGWLNRMLGLFDGGAGREKPRALALAPVIPLALQGAQKVTSYAPSRLPDADGDLIARVSRLYEGDAQLSSLWADALKTRAMAGDLEVKNLRKAGETGKLAASLMRGEEGARIMMIESNGWDSHAGQPGQLGNALGRLDGFLGAFRQDMGDLWRDTLVLVATEFGRTARRNGTNGTDHGTASAALLIGGAVKGGRVLADWPGLGARDLYQGRDLRPTHSLEALLAGAIAEHFALDPARAMAAMFPGRSSGPASGLIRV